MSSKNESHNNEAFNVAAFEIIVKIDPKMADIPEEPVSNLNNKWIRANF